MSYKEDPVTVRWTAGIGSHHVGLTCLRSGGQAGDYDEIGRDEREE